MTSRTRGFTLIELLVVMAIIGTLVGLGVAILPSLIKQGPKTAAKTFISTLSASLQAYHGTEGAFPPTTLAEYAGVGSLTNNENMGIESVVVCLNSNRYAASFDFKTAGCTLENYDGDRTQVQLTRFGDEKALFEAIDPWNMPYVYFHANDYARGEELGRASGDTGPVKCLPWKDPKLKRPYRWDSFQLISAGPDRIFNTGDDLTNFERE